MYYFCKENNHCHMNEIELVKSKIYEFRGQRVMLDSDLAQLYGVTTGNFNKAVKRNLERFPDDFMFRLSDEEFSDLKFQTGIASTYGGRRTTPYVFTEQGVAMLSSVLKSEAAIRVNIGIMRAFVMVRQTLVQPSDELKKLQESVERLREYVDDILTDQNDINEETQAQLDAISESLADLQAKKSAPRKRIGFVP